MATLRDDVETRVRHQFGSEKRAVKRLYSIFTSPRDQRVVLDPVADPPQLAIAKELRVVHAREHRLVALFGVRACRRLEPSLYELGGDQVLIEGERAKEGLHPFERGVGVEGLQLEDALGRTRREEADADVAAGPHQHDAVDAVCMIE